jgi:hypothetical protein
MEVTVRIDDRKIYDSFVAFIRSLGIAVVKETPQPKAGEHESVRKKKRDYPLAGSVLKYDDPFEPAVDPDDWEVNK